MAVLLQQVLEAPNTPAAIRQASATGRDFPLPSCAIIAAARPKSSGKESQLQAAGLGDSTCPAERERITSSVYFYQKKGQ